MKAKRFLGLVLAMCLIATSVIMPMGASAAEVPADGIYYYNTMDSTAADAYKFGDGSWPTKQAKASFVDTEDYHGNVIKVTGGTSGWDVYKVQLNDVTGGNTISGKRVGISFQIKANTAGGYSGRVVHVATSLYTANHILTACPKSCVLGANWNYEKTDEMFPNGEWTDVDLLVDQNTKEIQAYVNGSLFHTNATTSDYFDSTGAGSFKTLGVEIFGADNGDSKLTTFMDGFKLYDIDASDFKVLKTTIDDKDIYLELNSSLAGGTTLDGVKLLKVGTNEAINANAEILESQIIKISATKELEKGNEYQVVFPSNVEYKDVFGRKLKADTTIFIPSEDVNVDLYSTGFTTEEGWSDYWAWQSLPTGWSVPWYCNWGSACDQRLGSDVFYPNKTPENEDYSGGFRAMKMRVMNDGRPRREIAYELPELPDNSTLKVNYKFLVNGTAVMWNMLYKTSIDESNSSYTLCANYQNTSDNHNGGLTTSTGSQWGQHGGQTIVPAASFSNDKWYRAECEYYITDSKTRATASYKIYDDTDELVGTLKNVLVSNNIYKPKYVSLGCTNTGTNNDSLVWYDDLSISYSVPPVDVKELRIKNYDGETVVPTSSPLNDISEFNFTLSKKYDDITATLTDATSNVVPTTLEGSDTNYTLKLSEILKGGTKYTLELDLGVTKYKYEFEPVSANKLIIKDFNVYKEGKVVENISSIKENDVIIPKAEFINLLGKEKNVWLSFAIYKDGYLKSVNMQKVTVPTTSEGAKISIDKKITSQLVNADKITAYLWNDIEGLQLLKDPITIK